jgi:cobalt/nickel transport protein
MRNMPTRVLVVVGLLVALVLAGFVSHYASRSPDGLNRVAGDEGFDGTRSAHAAEDGPLAGYRTRGVDDPRLSGGIAGVTGVLLVLALTGGVTYLVRRRVPEERD